MKVQDGLKYSTMTSGVPSVMMDGTIKMQMFSAKSWVIKEGLLTMRLRLGEVQVLYGSVTLSAIRQEQHWRIASSESGVGIIAPIKKMLGSSAQIRVK